MKNFIFKPTFTLTPTNGQGSLIETWYIKILKNVGFFNKVWGFSSFLNFWHNIKRENVLNRHIIILLLFFLKVTLEFISSRGRNLFHDSTSSLCLIFKYGNCIKVWCKQKWKFLANKVVLFLLCLSFCLSSYHWFQSTLYATMTCLLFVYLLTLCFHCCCSRTWLIVS